MVSAARDDIFDPAQIRREAMAWVTLMISKEATAGDYDALQVWQAQSPAHAAAYTAAVKLHRLVKGRPKQAADHYTPSILERTATRRAALGGAVMALAGYGIVRPPLGLWPSFAELSSDYRTAPGEHHTLTLAGNVSVDMNTRTSLARRDKPGRPGVELITGEVVIALAAEGFTAYAGEGAIFASQASFDLRKDGDVAAVTCISGQVQITHRAGRVTVEPAHQLRYSSAGLGKPTRVDPALVTAWQRGLLIFHNARLGDVVAEINRYRPGRIVIMDQALADHRLNGEFQIPRIENSIAQIQSVTNASVTALPGGIVLLA